MRVLGGALKGRKLRTPPGRATRPVLAQIRQSYFDILGPSIEEARVADLFAGSGSLGIEALSRGAQRADFFESGPASQVIDLNLRTLDLMGRAAVHRRPLPGALGPGRAWDVIFVDPPWGTGLGTAAMEAVGRLGLLNTQGEAIVRERWGDEIDEGAWLERGYELFDHRRYGDSAVSRVRPLSTGRGSC